MVCYVKPCFVTAALWIFFSLLSAQNGKWFATLSPALLPQRFEFFFSLLSAQNGKWFAMLSPALLPQRFEFFFATVGSEWQMVCYVKPCFVTAALWIFFASVGSNFQFWARWLLHRYSKRLRLNAGSCLATPRLFVRGVQIRWDTGKGLRSPELKVDSPDKYKSLRG